MRQRFFKALLWFICVTNFSTEIVIPCNCKIEKKFGKIENRIMKKNWKKFGKIGEKWKKDRGKIKRKKLKKKKINRKNGKIIGKN